MISSDFTHLGDDSKSARRIVPDSIRALPRSAAVETPFVRFFAVITPVQCECALHVKVLMENK